MASPSGSGSTACWPWGQRYIAGEPSSGWLSKHILHWFDVFTVNLYWFVYILCVDMCWYKKYRICMICMICHSPAKLCISSVPPLYQVPSHLPMSDQRQTANGNRKAGCRIRLTSEPRADLPSGNQTWRVKKQFELLVKHVLMGKSWKIMEGRWLPCLSLRARGQSWSAKGISCESTFISKESNNLITQYWWFNYVQLFY